MHNSKIQKQLWLLLLLVAIGSGCAKEKVDNGIPLLDVSDRSLSAIRLFNFYSQNLDVTINNIPLTAYVGNGANTSGQGTQLGLSIFPSGVWTSGDDGSPFSVLNSLLDKAGKIHIRLQPRIPVNSQLPPVLDTVIENDVVHPRDYYITSKREIKVLLRDNIPPANATKFKLRIINLGDPVDPLQLAGPVSLTYADGTHVSEVLDNVQQGSSSPYIELPYGPYQFKLSVNGDPAKMLSEVPVLPNVNPCGANILSQESNLPRVLTFKPGGVYSMVITSTAVTHFTCDRTSTESPYVNVYRVITEADPGVNATYGRMQALNAIPGKKITINVDGAPLGGQLDYIGNTTRTTALAPDYSIFIRGPHEVTAVDQNGAVLAKEQMTLYPYDNYTIWAYEKPDGKPGLLFEAADMTGSTYVSSYMGGLVPDDGTNGAARIKRYNYAFQFRLLNLSPDLPSATFTSDGQYFLPATGFSAIDTLRYLDAYINLAPGIMPARNPNIIYIWGTPWHPFSIVDGQQTERDRFPSYIRVYQSQPGNLPQMPGKLLPNITPLNVQQACIANTALYPAGPPPKAETGVYTIALVGKTFAAGGNPRLVIIKHNK